MNADALELQDNEELRVTAYQGPEGLERLAADWLQLAHSLSAARFMHFPQWYRAYIGSLATDPSSVWFLAAYRGFELVAVFPMQFQSHSIVGIEPRVLGTIEDDQMQLSDFVFESNAQNQSLVHELTEWLRSQRTIRWDELRLRKVAEDSSMGQALRERLPAATLALRHDGSSFFDTRGNYEQATASMSGSFRRNLRRFARRAEQSAELKFQSYRSQEELGAAFDTLMEIEASGWKGRAGTGSAIKCCPRMLGFYRSLVQQFGPLDACIINLLWHGGHAVAGQFCLHIGRTLSILKVGFHEAHSQIAPGNLLLERTLQAACENEATDVVSLVNQPPWSRNFKPQTVGVWSYCAPNWNLQGCLVHLGLVGKRTWDAVRGRQRGRALQTATEAAD
jgi:CelD/BcsL family acetyltransferase involved in cellulose biosynthesis